MVPGAGRHRKQRNIRPHQRLGPTADRSVPSGDTDERRPLLDRGSDTADEILGRAGFHVVGGKVHLERLRRNVPSARQGIGENDAPPTVLADVCGPAHGPARGLYNGPATQTIPPIARSDPVSDKPSNGAPPSADRPCVRKAAPG